MSEREFPPPRMSYHSEIERLLEEQGKTYADIARDIGLKSLGIKRRGELLREYSSQESKNIGYDYGISRALIAKILTDDDERTYKNLLRLSRRDRRTQRAKTASVKDSLIRDERELYAIDAHDAAQLLNMDKEYLLRLEQGKRNNPPEYERTIIHRLRNEGERRIREVLSSVHARPATVRALVNWITLQNKLHGGGDRFKQFSDRIPGIGHERIKYIIQGKDMPPLPVIKRILDTAQLTLTPELMQDWAYEFAFHERSRSTTDIGRALQTICAETYESHGAFEKVHGTSLKKTLQRIQRGDICERKSIHKTLRQLRVEEHSPIWLWIECLFKEKKIQPACRQWYMQMCERDFPINWSYQQLPGLTRKESPKVIFDVVMEHIRHQYPSLPKHHFQIVESATLAHILDDQSTTDVIMTINARFGPALDTANKEAIQKNQRQRNLQALLNRAKTIDAKTFACAPDRIADALSSALSRGITDTEKLIRYTLIVERAIQWAFRYNLTIASPYYYTLRREAEESLQKGLIYEEIQTHLQAKIDHLSARDQTMSPDDDSPGIHRAKSNTGRKMKGPNNY